MHKKELKTGKGCIRLIIEDYGLDVMSCAVFVRELGGNERAIYTPCVTRPLCTEVEDLAVSGSSPE